ncbi:hypothetical protein GCM10027340_01430 [Marinomonas epiphytica]
MLVAGAAITLSACSFTDHANDYQHSQTNAKTLEAPEGSIASEDVLVIPNEHQVDDLTTKQEFVAPRAPFLFHSMARVSLMEKEDRIVFSIPTSKENAHQLVAQFLENNFGEEIELSSNTPDLLETAPYAAQKQGKWRALWSQITRVYPEKTVFKFRFDESDGLTQVVMQIRQVQEGEAEGLWQSPSKINSTYALAINLWGKVGRSLNETSAFLSERHKEQLPSPIWVNEKGHFAAYLGQNITQTEVEQRIQNAGLYLMSEQPNSLASVPEDKIAKIGDVVDFDIPVGQGKKQTLFKVYRRDLDDVPWQERVYSYRVETQKAGDFLVIDTSDTENPILTSYFFAKQFIK